jgi:N-acetylglutamate synthase-like GNAT family acetyltransferase
MPREFVITVKKVKDTDKDEKDAFSTLFKFSLLSRHKYTQQDIQRLLNPPPGEETLIAFDAENEEDILGFINYSLDPAEKKATLNDIRVWFRSKRKGGIGEQLFGAMLRDATIAGMEKWDTVTQKRHAGFFKKMGYAVPDSMHIEAPLKRKTEFFLEEDDLPERQKFWKRVFKK